MASKGEPCRSGNSLARALLILVIIAALFAFAAPAEAAGVPTQLIVFTDRDVYLLGEAYDISLAGTPWTDKNFVVGIQVKVYVAILDDDGNMIKSLSGLSLNATVKDNARYYHNASTTYHSDTEATNGKWWNTFNSTFSDTNGDGIWETTFNLQDAEQLNIAQGVNSKADQFNMTVTVNETTRTLTDTTYVMFSRNGCGHGSKNIAGLTAQIHIENNNHPNVACTVCHWGWEHKTGVHGNNTSLGNNVSTQPSISNTAANWNYNTGNEPGTGGTATFKDAGRADICVACHNSNVNGNNVLDMYSGTTPVASEVDANDDLINDNDRPSCSWAKGATAEGTWAGVGCHDSGAGNITGTLIEKVPLMNSTTYFLNWSWKTNGAGKSYAHNRTDKNVACELCHGNHEVKGFPNASASKTNINEQCWLCHNITGGLNITSNAGSVSHTTTNTDCKSCHKDASSKLDVHTVPQGVVGGVNCTSCHNIGGTASGKLVNFTSVNKSMHASLNKNASSTGGNATNKPCWACHGTKNGTYANQSDQPVSSHNETVYQNPRQCYDCHNDTISQFTAKGVTDHIPSSLSTNTDVNTSSYNNTYCSYCHNNSVGAISDPDGFGLAGGSARNASVSHYGANKTAGKLMYNSTGNSEDCVYCHRNSSNMAAWGILSNSLANISNKNGTANTGTNHNSYTASTQCSACHGGYTVASGFTFHNAQLGSGSAGGKNCTSCHDVGRSNEMVDVSKMNQSYSIHNYLNSNATASVADNKRCWACHTNTSVSSDNRVDESELPETGHPDGFDTPKNCTLCHINNKFGALVAGEHYTSGTNIKTKSYSNVNDSCVACHNKSEMLVSNSDPGGPKSIYASVSHYGDNKTTNATYVVNGNATCTYCHNGSSAFTTEMVNVTWNSSIQNHTALGTNPSCTDGNCHATGRIHFSALSKPSVSTTLCTSCHATKSKHNDTLECSSCHLETNKSIHPVQYLQPDNTWKINSIANKSTAVNCTDCHQKGVSGFDAPIIPATLKHSSNTSNGSIWGTYWNSTQQASSSCYYCHNDTKHNATALGRVSNLLSDTNNTRNGSLAVTTWCADCHLNTSNANYKGNNWTPAPPLITVDNTGKSRWLSHSSYLSNGYKDSNCKSCHALNGTYIETSLNYSHSLNEGVAGGPNCISCHNLATGLQSGAPAGINFTAFNQSVHFGMNSINSTANGACWACHDSDGNVTSGHPDKKDTPKVCDECHLDTGAYYPQAQGWGLTLVVKEHYQNGAQIKAGNSSSNIASCINCHENVSEMILYNNDSDTGSFAGDGVRLTGGNKSYYHYGKDRSDLRTEFGTNTNCYYCHQNDTTAFANAMKNATVNKSIYNHSDSGSSPSCTNAAPCHNIGLIHDDNLNKQTINNNDCKSCHQPGPNSTKQISDSHNGTTILASMYCWNCHQEPSSPYYKSKAHGMMYPQADGSRKRFDKGTPANCTTCHVYNLVNTSTNRAIQVPPLNHSIDMYSGKKWGNYWDNTSMVTGCNYCHQKEVHKFYPTVLGNISNIKGSNQYKSSDLANSRWCSACHNNDSTSNYQGSILNPRPPEILNRTGTVPQTANDGTAFYNHSGDVAANSNDSKCKECHGLVGNYAETTLNYSHSLNEGGGGPDCVSSGCHGTAGSPTSPYMNWSSLKQGMHAKLNNGATNTTVLTDSIDKACWACHGDGTEPSGHPAKYKTPYYCADCHLASGSIAGKYSTKNATEHQHVDAQVRTNSSYARCENCHNNSLVGYSDNETNALTNYTLGNVSHYGANRTAGKLMEPSINSTNCVYCHLNNSNRAKWANATNASATKPDIHGSFNSTTQSSKCWECHVDGGVESVVQGVTLHNASLNPGASEFCLSCHVNVTGTESARRLNVTSARMGLHININNTPVNTLNNSDCWACHYGYPNGTAGSHSYNVSKANTYYCEDCHGPNKNETAKNKGIAAMTKNITNFVHGTTRATSIGCEECHVANESRKVNNSRVKIYHNDSAKKNASGVVSNPGWDMIDGSSTGCMDCHRVQNSQDAPFRAPGVSHAVVQSKNCGNNCHSSAGNKTNPHYQFYLPCTSAIKGIPCTPRSSVSPPELLNLNLSAPKVSRGASINLTALARDNYNAIENAKYRILNASGVVVDWTQMSPNGVGNDWGPYRTEPISVSIDTSPLSPGNYTVEVKAMAGGPRTGSLRVYQESGEWSPIYSVGLEVTT